LVHALDAVCRRRPESIALAWRGATVWTYRDLQSAIALVEGAIARRGLPPGTRIALLLRNSPQYVAIYYGVLAAACVAVPLNVQERAAVLAKQIVNSGARLALVDINHHEWQHLNDWLKGTSTEVVGLHLQEGAESLTALASGLERADALPRPSGARRGPVGVDDPASIIYTSGTTSAAKGVMLSQRNLYANAKAVIVSLGLTEHDHSLCVLPFHFSYGNSVLHSHLLCGARLTLEDNIVFPQYVLQRLQDERVSGFAGVPSTFAVLIERHRLQDFDLGHLRYVTQAGGPMPGPLLAKLREQLPKVQIFLMFGQTEATARISCLPPSDLERKPGSVGLPVDGVEIEIRHGRESVPRGTVGEICVRGPSVMLGYWNDREATAEVLRDGWLRTRDLGYLDDEGFLYVVGRATDMIKVGGFRVSPQEVEEVIAALEGVAEVAVVGVPDELLGQAIKAVVVPRHGANVTALALKAHCRQNLAAYKVPKEIEFAASLPRTASGKVQRFKLAGTQFADDEQD